jgi:hypothetical protein
MGKRGHSLQKKELKRMVSKLKFSDDHQKRNIVIVKVIGQIIDSAPLPKVTESIRKTIAEHGFEQFHQKLLDKDTRQDKGRPSDS